MFMDEMNRVFRPATPEMTERKKDRLLMRGVKEVLFAGLIRNPQEAVEEFLRESTNIEKTLKMRSRQFNRRTI